jgi:hypothetical protein
MNPMPTCPTPPSEYCSPTPASTLPARATKRRTPLAWLKAHPVLTFVVLLAAATQADNFYVLWHPADTTGAWAHFHLFMAGYVSVVLGFYFGWMRKTYPLKAFFVSV